MPNTRSSLLPWTKQGLVALGSFALLAPLLVSTSCATPDDPVFVGAFGGSSGAPELGGVDAGQVDTSTPNLALCDTTECPAGRATCPGDRYPCAADLMRDSFSCGACGNACPGADEPSTNSPNAKWTCVDGRCEMQCAGLAGDCNGIVDDGCETALSNDRYNCGACGNVCEAFCAWGKCDCAHIGPTAKHCGNECVLDFQTDDNHCGACGVQCPWEDLKPEWNAYVGCVGGACGQRKCQSYAFDCNGDLQDDDGNGCESFESDFVEDPNNCGGCGNVCGDGAICNQGKCVGCKAGEVLCDAKTNGVFGCFVLTSDREHCGGCGNVCPTSPEGSHSVTSCSDGVCGFACEGGYADCDGDRGNGCETNVRLDPDHCGACGRRCPLAGQACIEGQCAQQLCGPEIPR
jgi:hypothetical protein